MYCGSEFEDTADQKSVLLFNFWHRVSLVTMFLNDMKGKCLLGARKQQGTNERTGWRLVSITVSRIAISLPCEMHHPVAPSTGYPPRIVLVCLAIGDTECAEPAAPGRVALLALGVAVPVGTTALLVYCLAGQLGDRQRARVLLGPGLGRRGEGREGKGEKASCHEWDVLRGWGVSSVASGILPQRQL